MKGGHNRTTPAAKAQAGSRQRADRLRDTPLVAALTSWPAPPKGFSQGEKAAWKSIGEVALPLNTLCSADLLLVARLAQVTAQVDALMKSGDAKGVATWVRLQVQLLTALGLTPQSRQSVERLHVEKAPESDPLAEFT